MPTAQIPTWRKPIDAFAGSALGSGLLRHFGHLIDRPLMNLLWELQRSPRRAFVHDAIGSKP
jgi:hypothetical protein